MCRVSSRFSINRGPTNDATVDIDWTGDGPTADDTTFDAEYDGIIKRDHTFSTMEERVYTIHVSALDADGVEAIGTTKVFVSDDARVGIEATGLPTRILTGDTNTWEFEIVNGYPTEYPNSGYDVVVDFGDGTPATNGWRRTWGTFTVDHKYLAAGDHTVRASVTDRTDTAAVTLTASVREPVRIAGIDGPSELEAQTDGAFTVQIEDGWPPYQVEIDWGDGSELLRQQSEGPVSASHRYPEQPQEETYTITAFVEDAVPLGSEATKTVVVPGPLIVLGISNDTTHDGRVLINTEGSNRTQEATRSRRQVGAVGLDLPWRVPEPGWPGDDRPDHGRRHSRADRDLVVRRRVPPVLRLLRCGVGGDGYGELGRRRRRLACRSSAHRRVLGTQRWSGVRGPLQWVALLHVRRPVLPLGQHGDDGGAAHRPDRRAQPCEWPLSTVSPRT